MTLENINKRVLELVPYQPGKPIEELTRELGITDVIKLASNENPRGPGPVVRDAVAKASEQLSRYPDGNGFELKASLARHLGVDAACLTLGNGSNDVLELAARVAISPGSEGIVDEHAFVVYPLAVAAAHGKLVEVPARNYGHDLEAMLERVTDATRMVFIANPNNPTGTWVREGELVEFLNALPESVWVALDEAYFEYVTDPDYPDGIALQRRYPNLLVTRTFSKIHGLAALRVGYSVTTPEFADLMNRIRQPFNVGSLGLVAAVAALDDQEYTSTSRALNERGMAQVVSGLTARGLEFIPSAGNFVTFDCGRAALPVYEALLRKGVIVRPVANYRLPNHLRVTIGLEDENARFLDALATVL